MLPSDEDANFDSQCWRWNKLNIGKLGFVCAGTPTTCSERLFYSHLKSKTHAGWLVTVYCVFLITTDLFDTPAWWKLLCPSSWKKWVCGRRCWIYFMKRKRAVGCLIKVSCSWISGGWAGWWMWATAREENSASLPQQEAAAIKRKFRYCGNFRNFKLLITCTGVDNQAFLLHVCLGTFWVSFFFLPVSHQYSLAYFSQHNDAFSIALAHSRSINYRFLRSPWTPGEHSRGATWPQTI